LKQKIKLIDQRALRIKLVFVPFSAVQYLDKFDYTIELYRLREN
jgi:hypothetical protein